MSTFLSALAMASLLPSGSFRAAQPASGSDAFLAGAPQEPPDSKYDERILRGWKIRVSLSLLEEDKDLSTRTLELLDHQLYQITRVVPKEALEKLRKVPIWVEAREPHHPCMCYHPDPRWLKDHGMNPDKAGAVEIANAKTFLSWTIDQPWMVLHELAHAYHHRFLANGFENEDIRKAYSEAKAAGSYESVALIRGGKGKAYALTNPQEYFAEGTEAFFGTNDFYPFVRAELRSHDPGLFKLLGRLWGSIAPAESQEETRLHIRNDGDEAVKLFWSNGGQAWEHYKDLAPQGSLEVATRAGYFWEGREGDKVLRFEVPKGGGLWSIVSDRRTPSPEGQPPRSEVKAVNRRAGTVTIYWVDWEGKLKSYGEVPPKMDWSSESFEGHRFEAHENGKVVSKFVAPRGGGTWEIR